MAPPWNVFRVVALRGFAPSLQPLLQVHCHWNRARSPTQTGCRRSPYAICGKFVGI